MGRRLALLATLLNLMVWSSSAHASGGLTLRGWWVPVGVNLGGSLHPDRPNGFLLGAEASVVHIENGTWMGGYADVILDFGTEATRLSLGPEVGYGLLGVDLGLLVQFGDEGTHAGFQLRGLITVAFVAVYGRVVRVFGLDREPGFGEMGVLLKFPIEQ